MSRRRCEWTMAGDVGWASGGLGEGVEQASPALVGPAESCVPARSLCVVMQHRRQPVGGSRPPGRSTPLVGGGTGSFRHPERAFVGMQIAGDATPRDGMGKTEECGSNQCLRR